MAQRERFPGRGMNYTKGNFFVDTNILVYAYDSSADKKWWRGVSLLALDNLLKNFPILSINV